MPSPTGGGQPAGRGRRRDAVRTPRRKLGPRSHEVTPLPPPLPEPRAYRVAWEDWHPDRRTRL